MNMNETKLTGKDYVGSDGHTAHVRDFAPLYDIPEESARVPPTLP